MKIRNKLLLAITVPVGLLIIQIALVNVSVRELQQAATFIASTHETIEETFAAVDLVADLRQEAKRLPSSSETLAVQSLSPSGSATGTHAGRISREIGSP